MRPSIVLAPHTQENQHPDHVVAGRLVRDAARIARYGGVEKIKPAAPPKIYHLFYYNITQHLSTPDIVIDISAQAEKWEAAMRCHATQTAQKSYIDLQKSAARLLGLTIGVEYAAGLYTNDPVHLDHLSDLTRTSRNF